MKVAHFIDSGGLYGAEKVLLTLCSEQIKLGLEPLVVSCGATGEPPKALELACEAEKIPCLPWRMEPGLNLSGCKKLLKHLEPMGFDVFHSHGYKFNILLALNKSKYSPKFGTTIHGYVKAKPFTKIWLYEIADRFALNRSDFIVLVSEQQKVDLPTTLRNRAIVVQNGFSFSGKSPIRTESSILDLAAIGRLSKEKGFENLIECMAILKNRNINATLTIYGDGPLKELLLEKINTLGLNQTIVLAGYTNNASKQLIKHTALVMPSITEGLPITLLEAIDLKTPVIATKVGGIPSTLGNDHPFLIDSNHPIDIANAVEKFIGSEKAFLEKLSDNVKNVAASNLAANKMTMHYKKIYYQS